MGIDRKYSTDGFLGCFLPQLLSNKYQLPLTSFQFSVCVAPLPVATCLLVTTCICICVFTYLYLCCSSPSCQMSSCINNRVGITISCDDEDIGDDVFLMQSHILMTTKRSVKLARSAPSTTTHPAPQPATPQNWRSVKIVWLGETE